MTPEETKLIELFKQYENDSIPGTAYFEALTTFAKQCCDNMSYDPSIAYIHSYIHAAYRVGFDRGYKAGCEYEQELKKLDTED